MMSATQQMGVFQQPAKPAKPKKEVRSMEQTVTGTYVKDNSRRITEEDVIKVLDRADEIDEKIENLKQNGKLRQFMNRMQLLMMMLRDFWDGSYDRMPWAITASIVFAVLYFLNPVDLIPDFIPVLGYLDDAAVLALVWKSSSRDLREYATWKGLELTDYFSEKKNILS